MDVDVEALHHEISLLRKENDELNMLRKENEILKQELHAFNQDLNAQIDKLVTKRIERRRDGMANWRRIHYDSIALSVLTMFTRFTWALTTIIVYSAIGTIVYNAGYYYFKRKFQQSSDMWPNY